MDSGNFRTPDPYVDFASSAPYAVNVQLKVELQIGKDRESTDFERLINSLKKVNYLGYVILEYEAEKDPYVAIPPLLRKIRKLLS